MNNLNPRDPGRYRSGGMLPLRVGCCHSTWRRGRFRVGLLIFFGRRLGFRGRLNGMLLRLQRARLIQRMSGRGSSGCAGFVVRGPGGHIFCRARRRCRVSETQGSRVLSLRQGMIRDLAGPRCRTIEWMTAVRAGAHCGIVAGCVQVLKLRGGWWNVIFASRSDFCAVGLDVAGAITRP